MAQMFRDHDIDHLRSLVVIGVVTFRLAPCDFLYVLRWHWLAILSCFQAIKKASVVSPPRPWPHTIM